MKQKTQHIALQQLDRYAVHLFSPDETDYDGKRLSDKDVEQITTHLDSCEKCTKSFQKLQTQLWELDQFLDEQSLPEVTVGGKKRKKIDLKVRRQKIRSQN